MTQSYSNETAYTTYRTALQSALDEKELVKELRKQGEQAAVAARYATSGTMSEKLAAVRAAWLPFNERIAQVEAEITENYKIADDNFDTWKGLK